MALRKKKHPMDYIQKSCPRSDKELILNKTQRPFRKCLSYQSIKITVYQCTLHRGVWEGTLGKCQVYQYLPASRKRSFEHAESRNTSSRCSVHTSSHPAVSPFPCLQNDITFLHLLPPAAQRNNNRQSARRSLKGQGGGETRLTSKMH